MSFGFYRSEILGALFSTLVIWILTGVLIYIAIIRIIDQTFVIEPVSMLITACMAVIFNMIMFFILHTNIIINGIKIKHGHSHLDDHQDPIDIRSKPKTDTLNENESNLEAIFVSNISVRSAVLHVVGDFIQSIGVMVAAIVVYIKVIERFY
jgi:zinc transporter 2